MKRYSIDDRDNPVNPFRTEPIDQINAIKVKLQGGAGSGNFGHAGRPGKRGGSSKEHFDYDPATLELREVWEAGGAQKWKQHVREYVQKTLEEKDLIVWRTREITGVSNEGYGDAFFTSLSRLHATGYSKGGPVISYKIPKGSKLYDEETQGRNTDVVALKKQGYAGILRTDLNEIILFRNSFHDIKMKLQGGPGSGNFGHAGRPGKVGGSTKKYLRASKLIVSKKTPEFDGGYNRWVIDRNGNWITIDEPLPYHTLIYAQIVQDSPKKYSTELVQKADEILREWKEEDWSFEDQIQSLGNFISVDVKKMVNGDQLLVKVSPHSPKSAVDAALRKVQSLTFDGKLRGFEKYYFVWKGYYQFDIRELEAASGFDFYGGQLSLRMANAKTIESVKVKLQGGPGSGNFGHAGRPGKVGGSAKSNKGVPVYHTIRLIEETPVGPKTGLERTMQSIKREGLKLGHKWMGRPPSVYYTTSLEDAKFYATKLFDPHGGMYFGIVEFSLPEGVEEIRDEFDTKDFPDLSAYRIETPIPPENIEKIYMYAPGGAFIDETGHPATRWDVIKTLQTKKIRFAIFGVVLKMQQNSIDQIRMKLQGGPGSGNFGHAGRPGKVGGSAPTKGVPGAAARRKRKESILSPKPMKEFENKIRDLNYEVLGVYAQNGDFIFSKEGTGDAIGVTAEDVRLLYGSTATHNHPSGWNFSQNDLDLAEYAQIRELRVVTKEYTYVLVNEDWTNPFDTYKEHFRDAIRTVSLKENAKDDHEFNHMVMTEYAKNAGLKYTRTKHNG